MISFFYICGSLEKLGEKPRNCCGFGVRLKGQWLELRPDLVITVFPKDPFIQVH